MLDFSKISQDMISSFTYADWTISAKNRTLIVKNERGGGYTVYEDGEVLVTGKWTTTQLKLVGNLVSMCE